MASQEFIIENAIQKAVAEQRAEYDGTNEEFDKLLKKKLPKIIKELLEGICEDLYNYCFDENNDLRNHQREINKSIRENYANGLKLVESFIEMNSQVSVSTYDKYLKSHKSYDDQIKLDTLISLHVRACQVSNEIRVLVENGYADGAMSRWRTLHELCVTFLFLYDNDENTSMMYNDYHVIEQFKKAKEYQASHIVLNMEPLSKEEMSHMETERDEVLKEYGKDFGKSYGWTMNLLPFGRRNFREMEKSVEQDHYRPVYAWASENIHSGVSGINRRLSLRENEQGNLLPSANDYGFIDPIQYMTVSLLTMSEAFLDMEDSTMNRIYIEFLYVLQNEVVKEFNEREKTTTDNEEN